MPASTVAVLLDYESNFENALATHFSNTLSNVQILTPRVLIASAPILVTPRVTISTTITGTNPNQTGTRPSDGSDYDSHKIGTIQLAATTRRDATGQALGTLRGQCRQAMLQATAALNSNTLPYYQTVILREASTTSAANPDNDEIASVLTYNLEFYIKPDQWPAS